MKKIFFALFSLIVFSCAGPTPPVEKTYFKSQKVVIKESYTGKYSKVYFDWKTTVDSATFTFEGSNGGFGYYYKKYSFNVGDTVVTDVVLCKEGANVFLDDVKFEEYFK